MPHDDKAETDVKRVMDWREDVQKEDLDTIGRGVEDAARRPLTQRSRTDKKM